jgi:hypothetical protein
MNQRAQPRFPSIPVGLSLPRSRNFRPAFKRDEKPACLHKRFDDTLDLPEELLSFYGCPQGKNIASLVFVIFGLRGNAALP